MKSTLGLLGSLMLVGLTLNCGNITTMASNDLATAPADQSVAKVDMATAAADMVTPSDLATFNGYNGCTTAMFMDQSAQTASRTVSFVNYAYTPKCILISANQMVTFSGSFSAHPLRPGVGSVATTGSPNNPIMATSTGASAVFTFPTAGDYPYNCQFHDGMGMNGVVRVK